MSKPPDAGSPLRPGTRSAKLSVRQQAQPRRHHETECSNHEDTSKRHPLTIASVALLLFAVTTAAVGQVMLKHGMQTVSRHAGNSSASLAVSAATSPWVLVGLAVFGISAMAWLAALSRVPLSVAYPFNALGYLGILTASVLVLHERANILTWTGTLLVVSGLIIVVLSRP